MMNTLSCSIGWITIKMIIFNDEKEFIQKKALTRRWKDQETVMSVHGIKSEIKSSIAPKSASTKNWLDYHLSTALSGSNLNLFMISGLMHGQGSAGIYY